MQQRDFFQKDIRKIQKTSFRHPITNKRRVLDIHKVQKTSSRHPLTYLTQKNISKVIIKQASCVLFRKRERERERYVWYVQKTFLIHLWRSKDTSIWENAHLYLELRVFLAEIITYAREKWKEEKNIGAISKFWTSMLNRTFNLNVALFKILQERIFFGGLFC